MCEVDNVAYRIGLRAYQCLLVLYLEGNHHRWTGRLNYLGVCARSGGVALAGGSEGAVRPDAESIRSTMAE